MVAAGGGGGRRRGDDQGAWKGSGCVVLLSQAYILLSQSDVARGGAKFVVLKM